MRRHRQGITRHALTAPDERTVGWWLDELAMCEHSVACLRRAIDAGLYGGRGAGWADTMMDARLDRLAVADDACDAIMSRISEVADPWVREAIRLHWHEGVPYADIADAVGLTTSAVYDRVRSALSRVYVADLADMLPPPPEAPEL